MLEDRVRALMKRRKGVAERRMFGGLAFLVDGNMVAADALKRKHVRAMDFTGRPIRSMVYVGAAGIRREADLKRWVDLAVKFARTLPPK